MVLAQNRELRATEKKLSQAQTMRLTTRIMGRLLCLKLDMVLPCSKTCEVPGF